MDLLSNSTCAVALLRKRRPTTRALIVSLYCLAVATQRCRQAGYQVVQEGSRLPMPLRADIDETRSADRGADQTGPAIARAGLKSFSRERPGRRSELGCSWSYCHAVSHRPECSLAIPISGPLVPSSPFLWRSVDNPCRERVPRAGSDGNRCGMRILPSLEGGKPLSQDQRWPRDP